MMTDFTPVAPFDIDHGELDGISREKAFVLGYELANVHSMMIVRDHWTLPVHAENRERIIKAAQNRDRRIRLEWMHEDCSEGWMWLEILPKESEGDQ